LANRVFIGDIVEVWVDRVVVEECLPRKDGRKESADDVGENVEVKGEFSGREVMDSVHEEESVGVEFAKGGGELLLEPGVIFNLVEGVGKTESDVREESAQLIKLLLFHLEAEDF